MTTPNISRVPESLEFYSQQIPRSLSYANSIIRAMAATIDLLFIIAPGLLASYLANAFVDKEINIEYFILTGLVAWIYFTRMECSVYQGTIGKKLLKIKVTNLVGERISYKQANIRFFSKILSFIPLMFGFLMASFTAKKQALHDYLAQTLVVNS